MSAKVRNDGHFEHEPWQAAVKHWKADDWLKILFNKGCERGYFFFSYSAVFTWFPRRRLETLYKKPLRLKYRRSHWECGCSFHAIQLISNRSQSISVITAAQMALQSAPCKEWIIIITHNLVFNTCLLLQFFKLYTTVIHKSSSSFF